MLMCLRYCQFAFWQEFQWKNSVLWQISLWGPKRLKVSVSSHGQDILVNLPDVQLLITASPSTSAHLSEFPLRQSTTVGLLLGQRLWRWPNIKPTLVERLPTSHSWLILRHWLNIDGLSALFINSPSNTGIDQWRVTVGQVSQTVNQQ